MTRTLREAIDRMPYTRSELARRAAVSRTTALAVGEDPSRARLDTLRELALALGYEVTIALDRASDPLAAAAARVLLGELAEHDLGASPETIGEWMQRLQRYAGSDGDELDALRIIEEAARISGAHHREGHLLFSGRNDADRLVSVAHASGARWALSGAASLAALGMDGGRTVIFWTDDPKRVGELLSDTHRRLRVHTAADVIVAPAHPSVFVESTLVEDVSLVSPLQGIIDAVSAGGVDRRLAMTAVEGW